MKQARSIAAIAMVWFLVANLVQSIYQDDAHWVWNTRSSIYVAVHVVLILGAGGYAVRRMGGDEGWWSAMRRWMDALPIPRGGKLLLGALLVMELWFITIGSTSYPFADVGMFRWARKTKTLDPVLVIPKYYYVDDKADVRIIDLRKQHLFFLADHLGFGFNNEYTFSANFHYKALPENYEFLLNALRKKGVDTLWVGLQTVDYRTGEVSFDTDPVRAMRHQQELYVFYGPLYVPEHQRALVEDGSQQ